MIAIVAGNRSQAWRYAEGARLNWKQWFFVRDVDDLRGRRDIDVVFTGLWYERKDLAEIQQQIEMFDKPQK